MLKNTTFIRILSALALIPLVLYAIIHGGWLYALLLTFTGGLALYEWQRMVAGYSKLSLALGALFLLSAFGALWWIRNLSDGLELTLFIFLITWATDSAAYFGGRFIGGPKLAPTISPNKTISGAIAGLFGAVIIAMIFYYFGGHHLLSLASLLMAAIVLAALVEIGDLLESACKRYFGVKDSGQLIPGHGGILDRLDGLLLAAPIMALALLLL